MFAGHYASLALLATVALAVADDATGQRVTALVWTAGVAFIVCIASMFVGFGYHSARLCERCIAASPLDPQAAVDRWDLVLRFDHENGRKFLAYVILFAVDIAANWRDGSSWLGPVHSNWWGYVADIVFVLFIGVVYGAEYRHRRLYPWCPYCHWGSGGDHEPKMVDDPDPAVSR
jgi:SNF family Na+-dependent transporter